MIATAGTSRNDSAVDRIMLAHGGGGQLTDDLLAHCVLPRLGNELLGELLDSALIGPVPAGRLAFTIDSCVVQPLKFPGGDIGRLAVSNAVNSLAVCGAKPLGLALSLILAEGLERSLLEQILDSIAATAAEAGVKVVTGDTKVVARGQAQGMYISTAGVGLAGEQRLHFDRVRPGDALVLSGPIADHGLAVLMAREIPHVRCGVRSDVAPINEMVARLLAELGPEVALLREPTGGGLAGTAADLAARTARHVLLDESAIPLRPETLHVAGMLGIDPLEVACEGRVLAVVRASAADRAVTALRADELGREARVIGHIQDQTDGICELRTKLGGRRVLHKPYGQPLPRIC